MAFTRATGKHRRPTRASYRSARIAGMASLATAGVVGSLASPALAASSSGRLQTPDAPGRAEMPLPETPVLGDYLSESLDEQAHSQEDAAVRAAAEAAAKAEAREQAERARERAAEKAREKSAEKASEEAAKRAREAREGERRPARGASEDRPAPGGYVSPVAGSYVSTAYGVSGGMWSSGTHTGIDFHAASGTSVRTVAAGEVVEAGWGGAYGNNVVIRHQDGTYTQYGHLSSVAVSSGQQVTAGQQIGLSGNTGNSGGPHLHFEARTSGEYGSDIDPVAYLRGHGVAL
ncbi:M23 family metallopeptidase [Streptomyces sp. N2-109]|uniref:M23 family metallopeptidase n=1 Tax=Streptomyces gossypii TaxID=2883101 RepID=A0ABT2JRW9_9ACTN|nr:M23 family metallopeptidase [Streptomyces gossypii]MCT2590630.1 M23 family metallopeptidase [Streptomyces gossypii]